MNQDEQRFLPKVCRFPFRRRGKPAKSVPTSLVLGDLLASGHPGIVHRDETSVHGNASRRGCKRELDGVGGWIIARETGLALGAVFHFDGHGKLGKDF